jgi:P-type conjugative transfer protein TrbG
MKKLVIVSALALATASSSIAQQTGPQVPAIQVADTSANVPMGSPLSPGGGAAAPIAPAGPPQIVQEPDVAPRYAPPPVNLMSRRNAVLTTRERRAVALSDSWTGNSAMPARGDAGAVMFTFGSTLPSIVCAPLYVCDITLQPGEVVNDINVGDAVRWKLSPATSGSGAGATTHVIVKPTDAALRTNAIITTDRRVYVLTLVSRQKDWMPRIAFHYPDDTNAEWAAYKAARAAERDAVSTAGTSGDPAALDFNYKVSGDKPRWRPLRAYTDGSKTYVQFPAAMQSSEAPALVAIGADGGEQLVNYRLAGDRYVVDRVLDRAALLSGTGRKQVKVQIARTGRQ